MKIYHQSPEVTLHQGDCLDVLQLLPDNSINLIVTDPPYHTTKKANITGDRNFKTDQDYLDWLSTIAEQWQRVLAPNGSLYCFASPKMAAKVEVLLDQKFNILSSIIWTKPNEPGYDGWKQKTNKESLRSWYLHSERIIFAESTSKQEQNQTAFGSLLKKTRLAAGLSTIQLTEAIGEYGSVNHGGAVSNWETGRNIPDPIQYEKLKAAFSKLTPQLPALPDYQKIIRPFYVTADIPYTDIWEFPTVKPYAGKHPAEKPLDLITHIIKASSYPGDVILDSFAGSGVVGQAAKMLGRTAILIEIEEHLCHKMAQRFSKPFEFLPEPKKPTFDWQQEPLFQLLGNVESR
ncbi:DNA methyltransferase [Nodularia spumigena]|uniref:DNA methyltransferase n=1 Tax=Nodularia spumigena TaxID=70799 RepID=UPI00232FA337|nr:DNA methyltransferase [Nodularia spumigena]MDB9318491.1 DNA methyltransferase [Nodularia spumigena CS-590/01A]MDB9327133.1 DNA methyltransferase [Nodularia spumigena CS-590/02]MDB9334021.1 DNA methyltransferase [Nodularia spumigena CS-590/01]